jgi:hypothetical protein
MRNKLKYVGIGVGVIGVLVLLCGYLIPALIKGGFWVLLQIMYYPLSSLIVLINLFMWQYVYILYTERKITLKK